MAAIALLPAESGVSGNHQQRPLVAMLVETAAPDPDEDIGEALAASRKRTSVHVGVSGWNWADRGLSE